jgi:hypothetical protein
MYKLIVENQDIMSYCNNIAWNNDSQTLGTQLNFDSIKEFVTGSAVSLWNDSLEIVRGVAIKPTEKRWSYGYVCQDYSFYLKNKITIQFNGMCASDAIDSLLGSAYIIGDIVPIPTLISKIYKEKTLSEIIEDILTISEADQAVTYFKEIEGNILYIRKLEDMIITPNILLPKEINIEKSMENMKNRIEIVSNVSSKTSIAKTSKKTGNITTSVKTSKESITAVAEDTTNQPFYGVLTDQQTVKDENTAQAQNIANYQLSILNKIEYQATFEVVAVEGGDTIKANRMIYLKAGQKLDGYYKIKSANHTLTKGIHKVNICIVW